MYSFFVCKFIVHGYLNIIYILINAENDTFDL